MRVCVCISAVHFLVPLAREHFISGEIYTFFSSISSRESYLTEEKKSEKMRNRRNRERTT